VKVSFCELGSNGKGNKAKNPAKHNYVIKVPVVVQPYRFCKLPWF
jgi:hypothetical protein